jgi:hypothetical protein
MITQKYQEPGKSYEEYFYSKTANFDTTDCEDSEDEEFISLKTQGQSVEKQDVHKMVRVITTRSRALLDAIKECSSDEDEDIGAKEIDISLS